MYYYIAIRRADEQTEIREEGEIFYDLDTLAETPEDSADKARSRENLLSTKNFQMDLVYPVVKVAEVSITEVGTL